MCAASQGQGRRPAIRGDSAIAFHAIYSSFLFGLIAFGLGIILQGCRGDRHPMRPVQHFGGKGNGGIQPMTGIADITILTFDPVDLQPVNKTVALSIAHITQHQLPRIYRPCGAKL